MLILAKTGQLVDLAVVQEFASIIHLRFKKDPKRNRDSSRQKQIKNMTLCFLKAKF